MSGDMAECTKRHGTIGALGEPGGLSHQITVIHMSKNQRRTGLQLGVDFSSEKSFD